ncbi:MAG: LLM class flavin-dependent oxidoreductase [Chloroflexi bacterium]|nr:MAG: LLM class flavin-dependent oxidoreductase [Chloroflexota bacterium]TMD54982.1 MAG: LLM class flavin-dependent oxidoreductase [Chloroflexota bacterium]
MAVLGVMIEGQEGLTWDRWRHLCEVVEELGFESLWRSDHFFSVMGEYQRDCIETWVSLALCAEWTKRITFGPNVSPMTFRPPAVLARMATSVDLLAGGRLVLGVGAGWYEEEHTAFHIPYPSLKQRFDRLEEGIAIIRETWEKSNPKPPRGSVPLLIGGGGEKRTIPLAAREAAEWGMGGKPDLETYGRKVALLAEACEAIGRDPTEIKRSFQCGYLVGRDGKEILERAAQMRSVIPRFKDMEPSDVVEAARAGWLVGTPAEIAEQLRPYLELGLTRWHVQHFLLDDDEGLRLLMEGTAPAIA